MTIAELIGRLLAEWVAHGNSDVYVWLSNIEMSEEISDTIDFYPGYFEGDSKIVLFAKGSY